MKVKVYQMYNITYFFENNTIQINGILPNQVSASSFDNAKLKIETYLKDNKLSAYIRIHGLIPSGTPFLY